jgi:hypothetical protein
MEIVEDFFILLGISLMMTGFAVGVWYICTR